MNTPNSELRNVVKTIYNLLGINSLRTRNITKHVLLSIIYKVGHILATFLLVPLTIKFLDTENYGIWLTLSSFIAWFSFFDIGLGNGLRNKFAEARAKGNMELGKGYVSTAYYTIGLISIGFFVLATLISLNINWAIVFNTSLETQKQLQLIMPIIFGCFSLELILTLITSIYVADQNHSIQGKLSFITSSFSLLVVWLLTSFFSSSLLLFSTVISIIPIIILIILNFVAFKGRFHEFKPRKEYWKKEYFKEIIGLGFNFFVIQISVIVLFSSDNLIITQLFSPKEVVPYYITYKYMSIASMFMIILLTPYWSSITDAYAKDEIDWIRTSIRNLVIFSWFTVLILTVMVLIAPLAYKLWLGELVNVPFTLTICMALYYSVTILYSPFNFFLNGIGKIKIHMYSFAIGALLNIPLSIVLVKYTKLGVEGVILATTICVLPNLFLFPKQYGLLINKKAHGIWNA